MNDDEIVDLVFQWGDVVRQQNSFDRVHGSYPEDEEWYIDFRRQEQGKIDAKREVLEPKMRAAGVGWMLDASVVEEMKTNPAINIYRERKRAIAKRERAEFERAVAAFERKWPAQPTPPRSEEQRLCVAERDTARRQYLEAKTKVDRLKQEVWQAQVAGNTSQRDWKEWEVREARDHAIRLYARWSDTNYRCSGKLGAPSDDPLDPPF